MVLLGCAASSISTCPCAASSAAVWRSGARLGVSQRCRAFLSHSSVFGAARLVHTLRLWNPFVVTPRSVRAEVGTSMEEELKELPGDEKPKQSWHSLPSGLRLEVLSLGAGGSVSQGKAPLVFLHGSYHAAWCWAVHWMPYFASLGYDCYAVSLLGQGGSDTPVEPGPGGTIQSHARDVAHFISQRCERPPVLVGHSFGGLIVQYYLSQVSTDDGVALDVGGWGEPYPCLAGAVLACSVPPTGNTAVVKRFLMSKPVASIKVTLSLAAKMFATSVSLCRETFFSPSMPEKEVVQYQKLMKESSKVPLFDLRNLNSSLPVPSPVKNSPPVLVIGAENDFILDKQGIEETASFLGTKEVIVPGIAHDVMLDMGWRDAADVLKSWMQTKLQ
ncbi:hypothetical protein KC19_6G075000 [Ceratodon purpureus]|uniref:AB hydrolase-1 domain-containing protein n=1 Tax=Ceratodon purpureus TaxID=3225 RepID=A0A8T0HE50_CERPU|nr:hypothetical protein KC19_6G075000 [Ceratodon purpureus]